MLELIASVGLAAVRQRCLLKEKSFYLWILGKVIPSCALSITLTVKSFLWFVCLLKLLWWFTQLQRFQRFGHLKKWFHKMKLMCFFTGLTRLPLKSLLLSFAWPSPPLASTWSLMLAVLFWEYSLLSGRYLLGPGDSCSVLLPALLPWLIVC